MAESDHSIDPTLLAEAEVASSVIATALTVENVAPTDSETPSITAAAQGRTAEQQLNSTSNSQVQSFEKLPAYSRSLLKIQLPLKVVLAYKKQPLNQVLELGPGSIIQFEKSCEEMLDLIVGDQLIAQGEAVKVGDKFGLRVTAITLPGERFKAAKPTA